MIHLGGAFSLRNLAAGVRSSLLVALSSGACGGTLNAGWDEPMGLLPVDSRNPIVICNDGPIDNWQGEYAMLLANSGGPELAGIVISSGWAWPELDENLLGWQQMVAAAREGGLQGIPDPIASASSSLTRPDSGEIDDAQPNGSDGAQFIVDISLELALPYRPLVVVTGGALTDIADAYLLDPSLPDRVVVVSALGTFGDDGGEMGVPNGENDTWADTIVARKFRYVQVSAFYEQSTDLPSSLVSELPENAFTSWLESKQPQIWGDVPVAADQVGVLAVAMPQFVVSVTTMSQRDDSDGMPLLSNDPEGSVQVVTEVDGALASARFQEMLLDPTTLETP